MSFHSNKQNYQCSRCQALLLPFRKGIRCPNCEMAIDDADTNEYLDVIHIIKSSMKMHKCRYGRYFPGAWYAGNFIDHVQGIIYRIFDSMEIVKPDNKEQYLIGLLDKIDWGNQEYSKAHFKDIASEVLKIYKADKFDEIKCSKPLPLTKWQEIKKWFGKFLP